jgi:chromosome segregation ATPase
MNNPPGLKPEKGIRKAPVNSGWAPQSPVQKERLSAAVREDVGAVQTELRKAREAAASLQSQLTGKAGEVVHLKRVLDESSSRFAQLQESIAALRRDRHSLANEAMRATGLAAALKGVTEERDQLKAERDRLLQALADDVANKHKLRFDPRDVQVVELTVQVVNLKRTLEESQRQVAELQRKWDRPAGEFQPKTAPSQKTEAEPE